MNSIYEIIYELYEKKNVHKAIITKLKVTFVQVEKID